MAKASPASDTTVLALHGRLSVIDDASLTQTPVPEASSTASRTRLERASHISQSTPPGDSGSSLGLLCLDELSVMSLHAADGSDSVASQLPRGGVPIASDPSPRPTAGVSRDIQEPADSSDNESNTSDTMMPVVRLADEELQRLAEDLSDFEGNSLLLSSDDYDENERADGHSSNGGNQAYYALGTHQDGDGVEEPREACAGRYSSDDDDNGDGGRRALDTRLRGSTRSDSSAAGSAEGAASTSQGLPGISIASANTEIPSLLSRPDLIGSSGGGSRAPLFHTVGASAHESGSIGGSSGISIVLRNADTVRQRAEGRSVESEGQAGASALLASPALVHGASYWSSMYSHFELDNPEAQRRVRPMGDDLLSRQQVPLPVTAVGNKAATYSATSGSTSIVHQAAASSSSSSAARIVSSDEERVGLVTGAGEYGGSPSQGEGCETSQQLASRYMLPGTTDEDDEDDAGNVAMSSASEVTLTGFLHSPTPSATDLPQCFVTSLEDQQGLSDYLGSEAFKSGASALDMLRQDDRFHQDSNLTPTLAEGSTASWAANAAAGGGTSSTLIDQYMAARTEALGSLSGQAKLRPRFGDGSIVSPPVGAPRRLLLPDESASKSVTSSASPSVVPNWQSESGPRCSSAFPLHHVQPAAEVSVDQLAAADGCFTERSSQAGQQSSGLACTSAPASQSSPGQPTSAHADDSASAGAKKVSPIGMRVSGAHPGERDAGSSLLWHDMSSAGQSQHGSLSSTLRPGSANTSGRPSSQLSVAVGAEADHMTSALAEVGAAAQPDQAAEQSSIVSYSFVTKITSEARKAGAASSELAAYIIRLSQQQAAAAAAARGLLLPPPSALVGDGVASGGPDTLPAAVSSSQQASAKTGIGRDDSGFGDAKLLATVAVPDRAPSAPDRTAADAAIAAAAPLGIRSSVVPDEQQRAPAAGRGTGMVAGAGSSSDDAAAIMQRASYPARVANAGADRAPDSYAGNVVHSSGQLPADVLGSASVTEVAEVTAGTPSGKNKSSPPPQQSLPRGVAEATVAVANRGLPLDRQLPFSPVPAHSSDSSWFWSSDATASSSKSLSIDFSAEDVSLLKQHSGASEPARLSITPGGQTHGAAGNGQGAAAAAAALGARPPMRSFNAAAGASEVAQAAAATAAAFGDRDTGLARLTEHLRIPSSNEIRSRVGVSPGSTTFDTDPGLREEAGGLAASSQLQASLPVSLASPSAAARGRSASPKPFAFSTARTAAGDGGAGGESSQESCKAGLGHAGTPSAGAGAVSRQAAHAHSRQTTESTAPRPGQPRFDEGLGPAQLQGHIGGNEKPHGLHRGGIANDHDDRCTIQVASEVRIDEVCCVGFSLQTQLEMYNPNSRWVLAALRVMNQSLDGSEEKCANSVPFILKQKARLEPKATEIIPIVFAPQRPGMYMAQLHVDTSWLVPAGKAGESGSSMQHTSTAIVNILANAELPQVEALNVSDGCINYGNVPWKCSRHFQVSLVNKGHAGIPLRLIISGMKSSSYGCFSFSIVHPESSGGVHEAGSKVIQNTLLPARSVGSSCGIVPVDVAVTFTAPVKPFGCSSNVTEIFQALLKVELDNPSAVKPLLAVKLLATVGTAKIHTPAVEGVDLIGSSGMVIQESIPIRNAGSIPFVVQFSASGEDSNAFTVVPSRTFLNPNEDFRVVVKCDTRQLTCNYLKSVLLMTVEPDGPTFEVGLTVNIAPDTASAAATSARLTGDVVPNRYGGSAQHGQRSSELALSHGPPPKDGKHVDAGMPGIPGDSARSSGSSTGAVLYSNKSCVSFGGVPAGQTMEQTFNLRNVLAACVRVLLEVSLSSKTLAACREVDESCCFELVGSGCSDGLSSGGGRWKNEKQTKRELVLMPFEDYTVHIRFAPRQAITYSAKLKIFCMHNSATYMVRLSGYGGTGLLAIENYHGGSSSSSGATVGTSLLETRGGVWQLSLGSITAGRSLASADVLARNTGSRSVFVRAVCFTDNECATRMPAGRITIQPEQFVLAPASTKVISIVYSLSEKEHILCEKAAEIIGVVSLYYGDEIMRQKLKRLLKSPKANAKVKLKHRLGDCNFDFYFLHEEKFDEDPYLPDDPREVDQFFSSVKERRLELVGYPATGRHISYKHTAGPEEISMQPLMFLEDTLCNIDSAHAMRNYPAMPPARYPAERPMLDIGSAKVGDADDSWTVDPAIVLLTVVKSELERQIKKVRILNNSESSLSFDLSWPASYVVVTPESGYVEPRSSVNLCLSARAGLSRQLPWSGCLYVMARSTAKPINIVIEEATTSAASAPYIPEPRQLGSTPSLRHGRLQSSGEPMHHSSGSVRHPVQTDAAGQLFPVKMEMDPHSTVKSDPYSSAMSSTGTRHSSVALKSGAGDSCAPGNSTVYVRHKEPFPVTAIGQSSTVKMTLCNRGTVEQKVFLMASPPFAIKQSAVSIRPGHFVKLPVTFRPAVAGTVQGQLVITSSDGKKQSLTLKATCAL